MHPKYEDDRVYFYRNSGRNYRVRWASLDEVEVFHGGNPDDLNLPYDLRWFAAVKRVNKNEQIRKFFVWPKENVFSCDVMGDEKAKIVFERAVIGITPKSA